MTLSLNRPTPDLRLPAIGVGPNAHFFFLSSCPETWGGSEELWYAAALRLVNAGHKVTVCKTVVDRTHPRIVELLRTGAGVHDYWRVDPSLFVRVVGHLIFRFVGKRFQRGNH